MTDYLRDFINENVSPECGGDESGGIVNPNTLQRQLNELKGRVDKIEAGIGFTLTLSERVIVPCVASSLGIATVVPISGTLTSLALISSHYGPSLGVVSVDIIRYSGSDSTTTTLAIDNTLPATNNSVDIPVLASDIIAITYKTVSDDPTITPQLLYGAFLMQLPEETHVLD